MTAWPQEVDTTLFRGQASRFTVLDQVDGPAERRALEELLGDLAPEWRKELAEAFLQAYPRSASLAAVLDVAAKAAIDSGDLEAGIRHAESSLRMLPENPLLWVALSDAQSSSERLADAAASAGEALYHLDRFEKPSRFRRSEWEALEPELRAVCHRVLGQAALTRSFRLPVPQRAGPLREAAGELTRSRALDRSEPLSAYLLGVALALAGDVESATRNLADAYRMGGAVKARAAGQLRAIASPGAVEEAGSLERFAAAVPPPAVLGSDPAEPASDAAAARYAGSDACRDCHSAVYDSWRRTGMARMLQAYEPANVLGDFATREPFLNDRGEPVARLGEGDERPYMEFRDDRGAWRRFGVDYTIGSKWQQAYATETADGRIQVFPLQYSSITRQWLNFWKVIDPPGTERVRLGEFHRLGRATNYQVNCASCHTSQLRTTGARRPADFAPLEPGVNCEMCHGPSGDHVDAFRAGRPESGLRPVPVRFGEVASERYLDICGRCHMQSNLFDLGPNGEVNFTGRADEFVAPYKGRPISEFSAKAFHRDGRFRETTFIGESLARSACYRRGGAHCGSCHNPHPPDPGANPASLKFPGDPDRMCLQCHAGYADAPERHTRHPAASEGSRCASCHMPRIMHALMFDASTHRIDDVPRAEPTARFGRRSSPNACLLCHRERDAEWLARELADWPAPGR